MDRTIRQTPEMFEWNGRCKIGQDWVSNGVWLLPKDRIENAKLFEDLAVAEAFLPDISVQSDAENEKLVAKIRASAITTEYESTELFNKEARLFISNQDIVFVDVRMVEAFDLDCLMGSGPGEPLFEPELSLWLMPMRPQSSFLGKHLSRLTHLNFLGK